MIYRIYVKEDYTTQLHFLRSIKDPNLKINQEELIEDISSLLDYFYYVLIIRHDIKTDSDFPIFSEYQDTYTKETDTKKLIKKR